MVFALGMHYSKLEKAFKYKKLEGKSIPEVVKVIGKPSRIEYVGRWTYNMDTFKPDIYGDYYFRLTYYTNNPVLNFIGWFPCGGIRIFADKNGVVTGIKEYCY